MNKQMIYNCSPAPHREYIVAGKDIEVQFNIKIIGSGIAYSGDCYNRIHDIFRFYVREEDDSAELELWLKLKYAIVKKEIKYNGKRESFYRTLP